MDGTILEKKLKIEEKLAQLNEVAQKVDDMPTFTSNDRAFLEGLPGFPSEDGKKVLTATTESGETSLQYEEVESGAVDYSTTEQATGQKWIDGKDIYFKTYEIQALPNATTARTPTGLTDLDKVIKIEGVAYGNDTHNPLPFVSTNVQYSIECWVDNSDNIVITSSADYSSYSGVVTLYYTKAEVTAKRSKK